MGINNYHSLTIDTKFISSVHRYSPDPSTYFDAIPLDRLRAPSSPLSTTIIEQLQQHKQRQETQQLASRNWAKSDHTLRESSARGKHAVQEQDSAKVYPMLQNRRVSSAPEWRPMTLIDVAGEKQRQRVAIEEAARALEGSVESGLKRKGPLMRRQNGMRLFGRK
ncbi:hypothetical protein HDV00_010555 [Rhizophlyctis rosea]|nr:hypothetical protein HDV00_010555 [Rhizophlyctis rosea]